MSERIALDYTNGVGETVSCETWTNADPKRVGALALKNLRPGARVSENTSLIELATLVEPRLPPAVQIRAEAIRRQRSQE